MSIEQGQDPESHLGGALTDLQILALIDAGEIVLDPFVRENIKSSSVDVCLGPYYYRQNYFSREVYNPWNETHVRELWGEPQIAQTAYDLFPNPEALGYKPHDQVIVLHTGELILVHTIEFVGARTRATSMMKARSSVGRNGIAVCMCAGWGDVGYFNRWTMEIKNNGKNSVGLIVGERVAQIVFIPVGDTMQNYAQTGKYQTSTDIETLKAAWKPDDMIPKMWRDRI